MEHKRKIRPISTNKEKFVIDSNKYPLFSALSELTARLQLASQLGVDTYSGDRDIYQALGYPKTLIWENYWARYKRHDIAKAIIDRPVKASWKGNIEVIETIKKEETPFEKAWVELFNRLKLKSIFIRSDKLTGIGRYSVLFLGLNDTQKTEDLAGPVKIKQGLKLLYVKPLSENTAQIQSFDENPASERYGLPLTYNIAIAVGEFKSATVLVHYSRVIHFVEEVVEDEVYGTPRLEAVYNRLIDLEKLVGGDAEMFWRGARPGYTGEVKDDYQMTPETLADLKTQIDEFENNLRRVLINEGVKYNALTQQISDPANHVDIQIQMVSAVTGIPKRILSGSERGELSSAQDKLEWISYVASRREEQNEPMILRPFIDKCVEIGLLPKPKTAYIIVWDKLFSLSDKEKVEIGRLRAEAIKSYGTSSSQDLFPLDLFCKLFLNFDDTQIAEIMDRRKEGFEDEDEMIKDTEDGTGGIGRTPQLSPIPVSRTVDLDKRGG
ncbi:MAG: DUF1073 domain-containing protein [Candidatus Omnitrophica bacterium]|jgi:hypothetical protein|nr:DUF1073 domain-containing protein [Candidatus Omnitrophota bacterium]